MRPQAVWLESLVPHNPWRVMGGGGHEHLSLPPLLFLALPSPLRGVCKAAYLDIVLTGAFKCAPRVDV